MIILPNNCRCSQLKISKQKSGKWKIFYRFYEPARPPRFVEIKAGINEITDLKERKAVAESLIAEELYRLKDRGYNPNSGQYTKLNDDYEIHPETPIMEALRKAMDLKKCVRKDCFKSVLKYTEKAVTALRMDMMPVSRIRRRHMKAVLHKLAEIKGERWTASNHNHYRSYLAALFEDLIEYEATEVNPLDKIKMEDHAPAQREVPTDEQLQQIEKFTKEFDESFNRVLKLFYNSGSRKTEFFKLQGKHVNLQMQSVQYLVRKGRKWTWVERPIVDAVKHLWQQQMETCGPEDYLFSKGLVPGARPISPAQLSRRWKRHMKEKLGITADVYSLKHLNATRNVDEAVKKIAEAQQQATKQTGHKSAKMIAQVYDIKSGSRVNEEVKKKGKGLGN